jgi:hypothetical protein
MTAIVQPMWALGTTIGGLPSWLARQTAGVENGAGEEAQEWRAAARAAKKVNQKASAQSTASLFNGKRSPYHERREMIIGQGMGNLARLLRCPGRYALGAEVFKEQHMPIIVMQRRV